MRQLRIGIFGLGVLAFVASIFFIGSGWGDTLWRTGVACMLLDLAMANHWPSSHAGQGA
ncbi:MAG: hypothetical protein IT282_04290 [Bacteroidetes bacterium]|nr:hypothetical protein [Bacteroidota bacterium]